MRRLPSPWWFGCAVLLACSVTVGREQVAFAGEPESKTLFAEGRKLREENKCAEAIIVFRRAVGDWIEAGDVIAVRAKSQKSASIAHAMEEVKGRGVPAWLEVDGEKQAGRVVSLPTREQINLPVQEQLIVELYSK